MTTSSDYDHLFKLLLIGDSSVGKTSILLSFTTDIYIDKDKPTIGVDLKVKLLVHNNKKLKLTIWDTAGQERFRTLTSAYYRGANAILLVYDITNRKSFDSIKEWLREVNDYCTSDNVIKMLVGNKVDKNDQRVVQKSEAIEFARSNNMLFIETSAKTQTGITQCFHELVQKVYLFCFIFNNYIDIRFTYISR